MPEHRKLAAIMFTDIVGYSALMSKNEKHALDIMEQSRVIQKDAINRFSGQFIKESGDQVLASFHSAIKAVCCAVSIQKQLKENQHLNLRIGIHIGDVVVSGDDIFGDCVTIASKIESLTQPNSICISEHVFSYIGNIPGIEVEPLDQDLTGEHKLPVKIYTLSTEKFPDDLIDSIITSPDASISRLFFWQELKRRKVIKVGSMYAATAFALLEAFDILFPTVSVPLWLTVILAIIVTTGFVITIWLAWVYDFTPEGLRKTEPIGTVTTTQGISKEETSGLKKWITPGNIIIVSLIIIIGFLIYPKIFNKDEFKGIRNEDGRISIAVMPFKNLTGDTLYNVWQEGLQNLVISTLTNSKELSVRQFSTILPAIRMDQDVNYASLTPSFASNVAQRLNTKTFILGSMLKTGSTIRIIAQLMNAESEEIYKTFQMEGDDEGNLFAISDTLSYYIKEYFDVKVIIEEFGYPEHYALANANSVEALRYYIAGLKSFVNLDFPTAIDLAKKSVEKDTNFVAPYLMLSCSYWNLNDYPAGLWWFKKVYQKADKCSFELDKLQLEWLRTLFYETPNESIIYIKQILDIEDQSIFFLYLLGANCFNVDRYQEAIEALEKVIDITHTLNTDYFWVWNYTVLGECYRAIGDYNKEKQVYEKGLSVLRDHPLIIRQQAISAFSLGETKNAKELMSKYCSIRLDKGKWPESELLSDIAQIYQEANLLDSAVKYHRHALAKNPSDDYKKFLLAWILIDKNIDIDEGLILIDSALKSEPDNSLFLDAKGWGLFKHGRYQEALEYIQTAYNKRAFRSYRIYLHLEELKRIISEEKAVK